MGKQRLAAIFEHLARIEFGRRRRLGINLSGLNCETRGPERLWFFHTFFFGPSLEIITPQPTSARDAEIALPGSLITIVTDAWTRVFVRKNRLLIVSE